MANLTTSVRLSSGHPIPTLGLGTWQSDDASQIDQAIKIAIATGYRHIDTAYVYFNEKFIGETLKNIFSEDIVKREDLFIVSKLPSNGHRHVEYFCRKTLTDLQLDYLDLYLIHNPISCIKTDNDDDFMPIVDSVLQIDASVDIVETWKAMESLVEKGLVRSIGLSNYNSRQIQRIIDGCRIKPANLQVECHVFFQQHELHEYCKECDITFTAYSPLGSPGMMEYCKAKYGMDVSLPYILDESLLKEISDKHEKTTAQILIRYLLQRGMIVIPKSSNPIRIKENFTVFDFELDEEDMQKLKSLDTGKKFFAFDMPKGIQDHPEYPFKLNY